jgi:hypothetical protein
MIHHAPRNCVILALVITLGVGALAFANERYDAWQAQRPFTQTAWATHAPGGGDTVDLDYFNGAGLNTFWDGVRSGSWASQHPDSQGLPTLVMAYLADEPDLPGFIDDLNKSRQAHRNMVGLILGDELPTGSRRHMAAVRDWIVNNDDPNIASMITISSMPSFRRISFHEGAQKQWEENYAALRPDVWLIQAYPFGNGGRLQSYYYSGMEWCSNWTKEKDLALWFYPQVYAPEKRSVPSDSQLRLQRFTALAYGARGFADFLWNCAPGSPSVAGAGYWDGSGKPTPLYELLVPINREIAHVAKSLIRLTPVGAYHMDSRDDDRGVRHWSDSDAQMPPRMRRTWKLVNVSGAANRNHVLVGFFRDALGQEYFMVVNKDHAHSKTAGQLATDVTLSFHPSVKAIQRLRRSDGTIERITVDHNYMFTLPGGTGDLFKFDTGSPFAGVEPIVLPKLVEALPGADGVLGRVTKNRIVLSFDRNASGVEVEIHKLDENGKAVGPDLAEYFVRTLSDDARTIIYEGTGTGLNNNSTYCVTPYAADARPFTLRTVRGDIDGDGQVTDQDLALATKAQGAAAADSRADLNGDGQVDHTDLWTIRQVVAPEKFRWEDSFEEYPIGVVTGQGGWLTAETLPGSVLATAWVKAPLEVTDELGEIDGQRKVTGGPHARALAYRGAELRFHDGGGFGDVGQLRCGFIARLGKKAFQNAGFHVWNSQDTQGVYGRIACEVQSTTLHLYGKKGRGVEVIEGNTTWQIDSKQAPDGKGIAVEILIDFEAATITIESTNLNTGEVKGPKTVHYRGRFAGFDSISLFITGKDNQMDRIWVQNY